MFDNVYNSLCNLYASRIPEEDFVLPQPLPLPAALRYMIFDIYMTDLRRMIKRRNKFRLLFYLQFPKLSAQDDDIRYNMQCGCHSWVIVYDDGVVIQNDHIFRYKNRKHSIRTFN